MIAEPLPQRWCARGLDKRCPPSCRGECDAPLLNGEKTVCQECEDEHLRGAE